MQAHIMRQAAQMSWSSGAFRIMLAIFANGDAPSALLDIMETTGLAQPYVRSKLKGFAKDCIVQDVSKPGAPMLSEVKVLNPDQWHGKPEDVHSRPGADESGIDAFILWCRSVFKQHPAMIFPRRQQASGTRKMIAQRLREGIWAARGDIAYLIDHSAFWRGEGQWQSGITLQWLVKNDKNWINVADRGRALRRIHTAGSTPTKQHTAKTAKEARRRALASIADEIFQRNGNISEARAAKWKAEVGEESISALLALPIATMDYDARLRATRAWLTEWSAPK